MAIKHAVFLLFALFCCVSSFRNRRGLRFPVNNNDGIIVDGPNHQTYRSEIKADYGNPLFLTPYIANGQLEEARNLSLVGPLAGTTRPSYAGYFTVNATYNSNLFFWYFPATINSSTAPVAIWLQGGPGSSSMYGLFAENGPFTIDSSLNLHEKQYSWADPFHMIYIDNPVGAGFSFTGDDAGYVVDQTGVGRDLYEALIQFFTLFPELQPLDFYATGESYGGKYVPAIAYKIFTENPTASLKINLKGFAIGDALIDPATQFDYGDYLFNVGLIDKYQLQLFYQQQIEMVENIAIGDYMAALYNFDRMINGGFVLNDSYYINFTQLHDTYNYLRYSEPADQDYYESFLQLPEVRKSIHVGNLTFNDGNTTQYYLLNDICQSTKPWLETLLENNFKILLYSGQVDVIVPYYISLNMIYTLNWKGSEDYKNATRQIWKVASADNEVAGYVKEAQNFKEILVRSAGHILPYDQPRVAYDMITRFIFDKPFTNE
ncbi:hypothetical protein CHUAL_009859 [Chamberlinius hualienensis]